MSTYKARKNTAKRFGIPTQKLLSTTALIAAATMLPLTANAKDVGDYDVFILQNTDPSALEQGYSEYTSSGAIIDNLIQEDIGRLGHTHFNAPMAVLTGIESGPMHILGKLTSTGEVKLLDVNGFLFGNNSVVDTQGFAAIGGTIQNADTFLADGKLDIDVSDDASIIIEQGAMISVGEAGLAAFVAPYITNSGIISAKMGTVALAAGDMVTLDLYGDGLVEVAVDGELADALIENKGTIEAEGGRVQMTALAAKDAVDNIINTSGVVTVASATQSGGKIVLSGGDAGKVSVSGTLDATGTTGGDVEVIGQFVSAEAGAVLDASGKNGGGNVRFGGDYQGGGETPTSDYAYVDQNAIIRANADEEGDAGQVIVWSDEGTDMNGTIEAKGGANGGDGGFVEVSSAGYFDFDGTVDTTAVNGETGLLLLDPRDVLIRGGVGDSNDNGGVGAAGNNNLGDGSNGLVASASNYGQSALSTFVIYESEIEGQSATTNIDIQARRNITTDAWTTTDGVVTLASGRNLNISTTNTPQNPPGSGNNEFNNNGVINLTNLGFRTQGSGSITVTGSTGSGSSDITVGDLRAHNGNITISTDNGNVTSQGFVNVSGAGNVSMTAEDVVSIYGTGITTSGGNVSLFSGTNGGNDDILIDTDINTGGGDFLADAGDDVRLSFTVDGAEINTAGGNVAIITRGTNNGGGEFSEFSMGADSQINTTVFGEIEGNVDITADQIVLDTASGGYRIVAQDDESSPAEAKVTIRRTTDGNVSLGDSNGGLHLSQAEVDKIFAEELEVGGEHTSAITVSNFDTTVATILDLVTLITTNVNSGGDDDVTFTGNNTFNALSVLSDDDIVFTDGSKVEVVSGDASFYGDNNAGTVGNFEMGETSTLDTNGGNVNISSLNVLLEDDAEIKSEGGDITIEARDDFATNDGNVTLLGDAEIDAEGGNITIDNEGVFYSEFGSSVRTEGVGTIAINQNRGTAGGASIQNVIDAIENTGAGQNTIFTDSSTYNENLTINENKLKIDGDGTVIIGDGLTPTISVEESDFNLDPVTVDANGATYGLVATGIGADGLVVDGNTFINSGAPTTEAGIYLARTSGSTATIMNNTFEGSVQRGIQIGTLGGGYTLNITDNEFGADLDRLNNGMLFGQINAATVNISGGNVFTAFLGGGPVDGDGIHFSDGLRSGATVNIEDINVDSNTDEAIDFNNTVRSGSTANIKSGDFRGGNNGIEFGAIAGTVNIGQAAASISDTIIDGQGADKRGINLLGSITGTLNVNRASIYGTDDAIGSNAAQANTVNGGTVSITGSNLHGEHGDGLELGALTNGASVTVSSGGIYAGDNGIHFVNGVNDSTVLVHNTNISAENNGILFGAGSPSVTNGSDVTVLSSRIISEGHGILFEDIVDGGSTVDIINNNTGTGDGIITRDVNLGISRDANGNATGGGGGFGTPVAPADGIRFDGGISNANVTIGNTYIDTQSGDGVSVYSNSPSISGGAQVHINGNTIIAGYDGIYVDDDITGTNTLLWLGGNTITAGEDGVDVDHIGNNAFVRIGGSIAHDGVSPGGVNQGNVIVAGRNGIEADAGVDSLMYVEHNRISAGQDGVNIRDEDAGHTTGVDGGEVRISNNDIGSIGPDTIGDDGIQFEDSVTGSTVVIEGNNIGRSGTKVGNDGIEFDSITGGSYVTIANNPNIYASDNGIQINGAVNGGATLDIIGNNHGIHSNDHGIYFAAPINGGATLNIHDNIIGANENGDGVGSGIFFDGTITNASINIGDGGGGSFTGGASNIIRVDSNGGGSQSDLDAIHFNKEVGQGAKIKIDGNRLGYYANNVGGSLSQEQLADDGIEFRGNITGNADIDITGNYIRAKDDGIQFTGQVRDFANIMIGGWGDDNNWINAWDNGISFLNRVTGQSLIEISFNEINAGNDGILFDDDVDNAKTTGGTSEQEIFIDQNKVYGTNNGIHFNGEVNGGSHDTTITRNNIEGENGQGIVFDEDIDSAHIRINNNSRIEGEIDGVRFLGRVEDGARVDINDNDSIEGIDEEAIHFFDEIDESTVNIVGNHNLRGGDNGVEFDGVIDESNITISSNNHGIHADDHGIVFFGNIEDDSLINIHDNVISANENGNSTGDGIHFGGTVGDSTINIGDGAGPDYYDNPSNIIKGWDGIHFDDDILDGARINIDGNRLGYYKTSGGSHQNAELKDDGIQFIGDIKGDARIKITENRIQSRDDGISFIEKIQDDARVTIGGDHGKGNVIFARGDGIQFEDDIKDHSLLEISYNDVDAAENGIEFNGETSNHIHSGHDEEILIKKNKIEGDEHGIIFYGKAEHERHDIVIRDNYKIAGYGENGITHVGNIDDAELLIENNDEIYGKKDGINVVGAFYNDAKIHIHGNSDVRGRYDDGIHVEDTGYSDEGADVDVDYNHVHNSGDDGIFVKNIENAQIHDNTVHNVGGNGIYGSNIDGGDILGNTIYDIGENGIKVNPSDYIDIAHNTIHDVNWDGILVDNGHHADIWDNHVGDVGYDGIDVNNNDDVKIWDNYIHDTGDNGIEVSDSNRALIESNEITVAGNDGINVDNSYRADILGNDIFGEDAGFFTIGENGAARDGIHVTNSDRVDIIGNNITGGNGGFLAIGGAGAGRDGIYVSNSDRADIIGNEISGGNYGVLALGGNGANRDGIHVVNSNRVDILANDIFGGSGFILGAGGLGAGDDGIDVRDSDRAEIKFNDISEIDGDGIQVRDSDYAEINWNTILGAGDDGIDFENGAFSEIKGNNVWFSENNGIEVEDSAFITIGGSNWWEGNTVAGNGESGIYVDPSFFINVENNVAFWNTIGIEFDDVIFGNISDNTVFQNLVGISLEDSALINVEDNLITNNLAGLWAYGHGNGYINVEGNLFVDNLIHAGFNSGIIDLTNEGNTFIGGHTALAFDASGSKDPSVLSLVREGGFFAGGYTYDGQPYDTFNGTTVFPPSNFGGTIGEQTFIGQSDNFVYVADNTFIDPKTERAIWLDAQDSHYWWPASAGGPDAFLTPSDFGGVLNVAQYNFLEGMFYHYRDVANRGIFFFGAVPNVIDLDEKDFLRDFAPFGAGLSGLNLRITGLPPVNLGQQLLNGIAPFAGEEGQDVAGIEPAAGGEDNGSGFADIEPAAGGEDAACWGDVLNAAVNGPVNYSFSSDPTESLNDAASCGS